MIANARFIVLVVLGTITWQCCIKPRPLYRTAPLYKAPAGKPAPAKGGIPAAQKNYKVDREKMMKVINSYLNTPYKYGGTTKAGLDCSGLVMVVFKESIGLSLPHSSRKLYGLGRQVSKGKLKFGDLVFFGRSISAIDHVGVFTGNGQFAHASTQKGVIISGLSEKYYRRRYQGAVRIVQ